MEEACRDGQLQPRDESRGTDGELTKRGPAAVGPVVWELVSGGVPGFSALAVESDLPLI